MDRIAFIVLLCLVFTLPWELYWVAEQGLETTSRMIGTVAFLAGVLGVLMGSPLRPLSRVFIPIGLYIAWVFASTFWSIAPEMSQSRVGTYILLAIFVWLIAQYSGSTSRNRWMMHTVIAGSVGMTISLYYNFLFGGGPALGAGDLRYEAAHSNANGVALYLIIAANFAYYLVAWRGEKTTLLVKTAYLGFIVVAVFGALLTGSRTGLYGLALSVCVIGFASIRGGWKPIVFFVSSAAFASYLVYRYLPEGVVSRLGEGTAAHTFQTRLELWESAYVAWLKQPIEGYGAGTSQLITHSFVVHNTLLGLLAEVGVVGAGFYMAIIGGLVIKVLTFPRAEKMLWLAALAAVLPNFVAGSMEYQKSVWLIFGMILAQPRGDPKSSLHGKPAAREPVRRRAVY